MEDLTPHPDWQSLIQQRDALRSQIAGLITELHAMRDESAVILGRYAAAFASRLTLLHALEIEAARLKREIELIQAANNSGTEIDFDHIHSILDAEFADWQRKLEEEAAGFAASESVLGHLLDPEETRLLREKFRILARRLHPDLNPGQSAAEIALWHRVVSAYERSDLEELAAIEIITSGNPPAPANDSLESLRSEVASLRTRMDHLLLRLEARGTEWPFDQLALLDDARAVAARQAELDGRIDGARALRDERKHWLSTLLDQPSP